MQPFRSFLTLLIQRSPPRAGGSTSLVSNAPPLLMRSLVSLLPRPQLLIYSLKDSNWEKWECVRGLDQRSGSPKVPYVLVFSE